MASNQDAVGKTGDESTISSTKLSGEGAKPPPTHSFLSICNSLVAGGVAGGV